MASWVEKTSLEGDKYYHNTSSGEVQWSKPVPLMSKKEIEASQGEFVWVPNDKDLWVPAKVLKEDGSTVEVQLSNGKKATVTPGKVMNNGMTGGRDQMVPKPLWSCNKTSLQHVEEDLVCLDGINDGSISHLLRERYKKNELYTYVGDSKSVLVSVNPYKTLNLYTSEHVQAHHKKIPNVKLKPHTFAIASGSYDSLLNQGGNQSILISGESGAGKTVCTKQCLQFLAEVAGSEDDIEERILLANPLLEAFGNAKTIRNNNSSRFGKYIEIHFNVAERTIKSAKILNYLLEKARVVSQHKGERNFHVFYQMAQDSSLSSKYSISNPNDMGYMNQSGIVETPDVNDSSDLSEVRKALDHLQFTEEEKEFVFKTTAAVLHLGNVTFKSKKEKGSVTGSSVNDKSPVKLAADFLGVDAKDLEHVLCYRSIAVRKERSTIPLDPVKAKDGRDALAKGIYGRLFDFLVQKVNDVLAGPEGKIIGILDIFGFEIFENNSFEQLCINYANEKLQQQFNRTTFKEEEALYEREGIRFSHIEFIDNQVVLDLIEKKPVGILLMLDEEGLVPEGSNTKFMNKIESQFKRHPKFQTDKHRKMKDGLSFEIVHYAGVVCYNSSSFLEKNKDTLFADMYSVCAGSNDKLVADLFPDLGRRQHKSLSYQFRHQLNDLMSSLYETESRYIRCVKPNNKQMPDRFETPLVVEQLRYSGVFEAVEIRKQGFPFRLTYRQFHYRYRCINSGHRYSASSRDDRKMAKEILDAAKQDFSEVEFGKTMVLYRATEHKTLKLLRNLALENDAVPVCLKVIRGGIHREFARRLAKATAKLQNALDVANDIDLMDEAIAAVKPTIGPLYKLFPKAKPVNLEKAKKAREDLQKWKDLEAIFERLTAVEKPNDRQFKELSDAVERASGLLDIPRTDDQVKLFDLAQSQVIYFSIKLAEAHLEANGDKYKSIERFPGMRSPQEFAKKKMLPFGRKKLEENMFVWAKAGVPTSLTTLQDKALEKMAVQAFKAGLEFAGDKKSSDPNGAAGRLIQMGIDHSELRDEIFAQIIKQMTANEQSLDKYKDLLLLATSSFTCSDDFKYYLLMHFQSLDELSQQLTSAYNSTKYGESPTSAPTNISKALSGLKSNKDRSRYSVMPGARR